MIVEDFYYGRLENGLSEVAPSRSRSQSRIPEGIRLKVRAGVRELAS